MKRMYEGRHQHVVAWVDGGWLGVRDDALNVPGVLFAYEFDAHVQSMERYQNRRRNLEGLRSEQYHNLKDMEYEARKKPFIEGVDQFWESVPVACYASADSVVVSYSSEDTLSWGWFEVTPEDARVLAKRLVAMARCAETESA
jgi:hypothetical protein